MQNFLGNATIKSLIPATAALTADTNSSAIDVSEYDENVAVLLSVNAGTGTGRSLAIKLQDSADGSTGWTDVPGASFTTVTTAASAQKLVFNPAQTKKFVRAAMDISGTTPSYALSAILVGIPKYVN